MPLFGNGSGNDSAMTSNMPAKPKVVYAGDKSTMRDTPVASDFIESRHNPEFKQQHFDRVKEEKALQESKERKRCADKRGGCFPKDGAM